LSTFFTADFRLSNFCAQPGYVPVGLMVTVVMAVGGIAIAQTGT
jgi:hypothetical protein